MRTLPNFGFTTFDMNLQRFVSQVKSKSGFINNVEYADPKWILSLETRGYQDNFNNLNDGLPSLDEVKAFRASLRGGIRSALIRHFNYICPQENKYNPNAAKQTVYLEKVKNGNVLTATKANTNLRYSKLNKTIVQHRLTNTSNWSFNFLQNNHVRDCFQEFYSVPKLFSL